jgi:hypothetical protein
MIDKPYFNAIITDSGIELYMSQGSQRLAFEVGEDVEKMGLLAVSLICTRPNILSLSIESSTNQFITEIV